MYGLVARRIYPEVPPRVEYRLTPLGRTLVAPLQALSTWAKEHAATVAAHRAEHEVAHARSRPAEVNPKVA